MNTLNHNEINIGIDTSQTVLDIFVRPEGSFQSFDNTPQGIKAAITFIKPLQANPGIN